MAELLTRTTPGGGVGDTSHGARIVRVFNAAAGRYAWVESAPETVGSSDVVDVTPAPIPVDLTALEAIHAAASQPAGVTWQATVGTIGSYQTARVVGGAWTYVDTGQDSPFIDVIIRDVTPDPVPVDEAALEVALPAANQPTNEIWYATIGTPGNYQTAKIIAGVWTSAINDPAADISLVVTQKWTNILDMGGAAGNTLFDIQTTTGPALTLANVPVGVTSMVVANNSGADFAATNMAVIDNPTVTTGSPGTIDGTQTDAGTTTTITGGEVIIPTGESRTFLVSRSQVPGLAIIEPVTAPAAPVPPTVPADPAALQTTSYPQLTSTELGGRMVELDDGRLLGVRDGFSGGAASASGRFVTAANQAQVANLFDTSLSTRWSFASASYEDLWLTYTGSQPEVLREIQVARIRHDLSSTSWLLVLNPSGTGTFASPISPTGPSPLYQARQVRAATGTATSSVRFFNNSGQREQIATVTAWVEDARDVSAAVTAGTIYEVTVPVSNINPATDEIDHENPTILNGVYTATVVDGSGTLTLTPVPEQTGIAYNDPAGAVTGDGLIRVADEASLGTPTRPTQFGYAEAEDTLWLSDATGSAWHPAGGSAATTDPNWQPSTAYNTGDIVLSAVPTGTATGGTPGQVARWERIAAGTSDAGGSAGAMPLAEETAWTYLGSQSSTFVGLTDVDVTGLADGQGFVWDAANSRLIARHTETWRGEVADTATRLALTEVHPGDEVYQSDDRRIYKLVRSPATSNANWVVTGAIENPQSVDTTTFTIDDTSATIDITA